MVNLFSEEARRNPFPIYQQLRREAPLLYVPPFYAWLAFDYDSVKRALQDHDNFGSRIGPDWLAFKDPPLHTKLRALISRALTPGMIARLEPRIREISRELLDQCEGP